MALADLLQCSRLATHSIHLLESHLLRSPHREARLPKARLFKDLLNRDLACLLPLAIAEKARGDGHLSGLMLFHSGPMFKAEDFDGSLASLTR
jgi:hypothetical protein